MITIDECKKLIPEKVYLASVDYRDSLDDHTELMQECLSENSMESLYDKVWEWYDDSEWEGVRCVMNELRGDLEKLYDEDEVSQFMELNDDELRDIIYDRDCSDVAKDLIRNTSEQVMFYSLGIECGETWCMKPNEVRQLRDKIRKVIGLPRKDEGLNKFINNMIYQASYGGELRVYFRGSFDEFVTNGEEDIKSLRFWGKNVYIAIANSGNGSGDHCDLPLDFKVEFKRENLYLDKEVKYSYTYDVCGMYSDWCSGTNCDTMYDAAPTMIEASNNASYVAQQRVYQMRYDKGGCTAGDMNYSRHRNTEYINNYTCGTRCKNCGTFWID